LSPSNFLCREFASCAVFYLNEPPPEVEANLGWGPVELDEPSGLCLHQQIYTTREIEPGRFLSHRDKSPNGIGGGCGSFFRRGAVPVLRTMLPVPNLPDQLTE